MTDDESQLTHGKKGNQTNKKKRISKQLNKKKKRKGPIEREGDEIFSKSRKRNQTKEKEWAYLSKMVCVCNTRTLLKI